MTRAVATTMRPIGVGARWRTLISLPTVAHPGGKCALTASPEAISIARIIIGVAYTNGMPSTWWPTVNSRETTISLRPVMPTRTFSRGSVILGSAEERWDGPSGCACGRYPAPPSIAAPQDPQM